MARHAGARYTDNACTVAKKTIGPKTMFAKKTNIYTTLNYEEFACARYTDNACTAAKKRFDRKQSQAKTHSSSARRSAKQVKNRGHLCKFIM